MPYQLYPEASQEGEEKYTWYKKSRYGDSDEKMKMYTTLMSAYGTTEGIDFKFGGTIANTLQAHRLLQHFQASKGAATADKLICSLYKQYFEHERHPSSPETLLQAAAEAGIDEAEARTFIEHQEEGLQDVKLLIQEQKGNLIDAVPFVVLTGRRRNIDLEGCREVAEYARALQSIIKECQ